MKVRVLLQLLFLMTISFGLSAQEYPDKPIRAVVPFPAGGVVDIVARTLGNGLSQAWKQPLVVDNRLGASGNLGAEFVARAAPDGYTILITQISMALNVSLFDKLSYDPAKDFAPVTLAATTPLVLVANPSLSVHDVAKLLALARSKPGVLNYSSAGYGTLQHLSMELFKRETGADIVHVPFKGSPAAMVSLIGGSVELMMSDLPSALPQIQTGKVQALATTSSARVSTIPGVPTFAEQNFRGLDASVWMAVFAPAQTPGSIVNKLNAEMTRILRDPKVQAQLASLSIQSVGSSPQALGAHLGSETARWGTLIKAGNIRVE